MRLEIQDIRMMSGRIIFTENIKDVKSFFLSKRHAICYFHSYTNMYNPTKLSKIRIHFFLYRPFSKEKKSMRHEKAIFGENQQRICLKLE